jgi:hypothetical protein
MFELQSGRIAIGDPVMGMIHYELHGFMPGLYSLKKGCLVKPKQGDQGKTFSLDSCYLYVVDVSHEGAFTDTFHRFGNACYYNMDQMHQHHSDLERELGVRVGFYWSGDLSGVWDEGSYELDVNKITRIDQ